MSNEPEDSDRGVTSKEAADRFARDLVERGEAVELPDAASLPKGATHAIIGHTEDGRPIVARRRFSAS
jgi:hypothetical protein